MRIWPERAAGELEQMDLPDCDARIVHVPAATRCTIVPDTAQTAGVSHSKVVASPELAVALGPKSASP